MRACLVQKILSCVMIVIVPGALFAADSAAMLYSSGSSWINGSSFPKSSAIFSGDRVQTAAGSLAKINASGSSLLVLSDSLVQFEGSAVKLEHGTVSVSTAKGMATRAGEVTITPTGNVWTQFDVTNVDGHVQIIAQKGDLAVSDGGQTTTLAQGQQTTRNESDDSQENKKKKKKRAGGAVPGASAGALDSPVAIGVGLGVVGGLATWVLLQGGAPVSPSR